jgi:streptogramin lyase
MKRTLLAFCAALLLLAAAPAQSATVTINNAVLDCFRPFRITIDGSGGVWFACDNGLYELLYFPSYIGDPLPPPVAVNRIDLGVPVLGSSLYDIAFDTSNNLWFTDTGANRVGKVNLTTRVVTYFTLPVAASQPERIVFAADGNMYVATYATGVLYRLSPAGAFTAVSNVPIGHHIAALIAAPGPLLIFGDFDTCSIYEYSAVFDLTAAFPATCSKLYDLNFGSDGNIWYAGGNKIGKLAGGGAVAYDLPPATFALGITPAPDGTLWYSGSTDATATGNVKLGQITTSGVATDVPLPAGNLVAPYIAARKSDGTIFFSLTLNGKYGIVLPAVATPSDATVIEFYWAAANHYFITAASAEILALDTGVFPGWVRTGESFPAWTAADEPIPNGSPVCRFYGRPEAGLDSHFYSASAAECQAVIDRFPAAWAFESRNVFEVVLPNMSDGSCPLGTKPLYRLYNNRADVNHRYTTSLATRATMIAAGWAPEGYGAIGVTMCVPNR